MDYFEATRQIYQNRENLLAKKFDFLLKKYSKTHPGQILYVSGAGADFTDENGNPSIPIMQEEVYPNKRAFRKAHPKRKGLVIGGGPKMAAKIPSPWKITLRENISGLLKKIT